MAPKDLPENLLTAYRNASDRLRDAQADATRRVQDAMSATPGWQAASKAAAAHAVLVASRCETEAVLADVFRAHIDAGQRNADAVTGQVRQRLLATLAAPGLGFFEGSAAEAASLKPAALRHAAEFETWRDALADTVGERFQKALERRESETRPAGARDTRRSFGKSPVIFGLLLVTAAMSLCGVSWLDIARKALALL